jgi:PAS domain S-box-containing protein
MTMFSSKNLSLAWKFGGMLLLMIVGFLTLAYMSYSTIENVRINGDMYNKVVLGKDLIADALPPPVYIVETSLMAHLMVEETDPAAKAKLIEKIKSLQGDFQTRCEFWRKTLPSGEQMDRMRKAESEAADYYAMLNTQFVPSVLKGDKKQAIELLRGPMRSLFVKHQKSIDDLVSATEQANSRTEEQAKEYAASRLRWLFILTAVIIVAVAGLCSFLSRTITRNIGETVKVMEAMTRGDLSHRLAVSGNDEIGRMANAVNQAIDATREAVDIAARVTALDRTFAVIEFRLDGAIANANEKFLGLFGYTIEEVKGRHHSMFVEADEKNSPEYREFWTRLGRGEPHAGLMRRIGKSGNEIHVQACYTPILGPDGKPTKVVKYAVDMSEQVRLKNEAMRLSAMIEQSPSNIMYADRDFKIRYANPATTKTLRVLEKFMPIRADQIVGQTIDIFHKHPEKQRHLLNDASRLPHRTQFQLGTEMVELNAVGINDESGTRLGTMVVWDIVTQRVATENQIRETADREKAQAEELRRKVDLILMSVSGIAQGDLSREIPDLGDDAIGQMARSLNQAIGAIRGTLSEVRTVAATVRSAAEELSAASEEIASGAQEQASSLEETAASLEEITATIKQNTDNAQQARQLANGSRDVAEKGGNVVGQAVDAMAAINQSSKKIADIITAIDEIAFQTNLLALNAAVEAARAGEQGRGFAVVAAEVRNLAQRSASAAKEIKSLIQDSVRKVDNGTELVNRSGSTLNEIVTSVKRVTDIVTEIAAASREQSAGVDQVNKAVAQMDKVTQTNAGQTEELSGTSQSLLTHAEQLQQLVARFRLGQETTNVPAARLSVPQKPARSSQRSGRGAKELVANGHANGVHDLDRFDSEGGFQEF